ncbi:hypothetical protein HN803_01095 [candidate division WWE3 bacterium]|jgi:hypothetical protein|nr:hypothetical protein [candidate division WWE3 bacterium]
MNWILLALLGYLVGRFGHAYLNVWLGNPAWAPHHWIYGAILIILGIIYWEIPFARYGLAFGVGHFISDLKDFLDLKFFCPDEEGEKKFWGID